MIKKISIDRRHNYRSVDRGAYEQELIFHMA